MNDTVVLIVDVQPEFIDSDHPINLRIRDFVENSDEPAIATVFENHAKSSWEEQLDWRRLIEEQSNTHKWVSDQSKRTFARSSYDATCNTELEQYLQDYDTVLIVGAETDACILATAYGVFSSGLRPIVLKDLCWTEDTELHSYTVDILERNIGSQNVITEDQYNGTNKD